MGLIKFYESARCRALIDRLEMKLHAARGGCSAKMWRNSIGFREVSVYRLEQMLARMTGRRRSFCFNYLAGLDARLITRSDTADSPIYDLAVDRRGSSGNSAQCDRPTRTNLSR